MKHRRIAKVGYAALIILACAVPVWTGVFESRPSQPERGAIALETKIEQRPPKPRKISIVSKKYISLAELAAEGARRTAEASKRRPHGD